MHPVRAVTTRQPPDKAMGPGQPFVLFRAQGSVAGIAGDADLDGNDVQGTVDRGLCGAHSEMKQENRDKSDGWCRVHSFHSCDHLFDLSHCTDQYRLRARLIPHDAVGVVPRRRSQQLRSARGRGLDWYRPIMSACAAGNGMPDGGPHRQGAPDRGLPRPFLPCANRVR